MRYKKRPDTVEAVQYNGGNLTEIACFFGADCDEMHYYPDTEKIVVTGSESKIVVAVGDYIVKDRKEKRYYVSTPNEFESIYEPLK